MTALEGGWRLGGRDGTNVRSSRDSRTAAALGWGAGLLGPFGASEALAAFAPSQQLPLTAYSATLSPSQCRHDPAAANPLPGVE